MVRWKRIVYMGWPVALVSAAFCLAEEVGTDADAPRASRAWSPAEIADGAYDDITAYNIFQPNRAALVADVEREPEVTDVPEDSGPPEPVIELPPPDPDASLTLVGISVRGGRPTAFVEDRATGEITELQSSGTFSQGEITAIVHNKIIYNVDGEAREIRVGFALTGERPAASSAQRPATTPNAGSSDATPANPNSPTDAAGEAPPDDGLTDLERRMRERRRTE